MSYVIERARRNSDVRCRPQPCIDVKAVRLSSMHVLWDQLWLRRGGGSEMMRQLKCLVQRLRQEKAVDPYSARL